MTKRDEILKILIDNIDFQDAPNSDWDFIIDAICEIIRIPSDKMINEAIKYGVDFDFGMNYDIYKDLYQIMIDAMLEDERTKLGKSTY